MTTPPDDHNEPLHQPWSNDRENEESPAYQIVPGTELPAVQARISEIQRVTGLDADGNFVFADI